MDLGKTLSRIRIIMMRKRIREGFVVEILPVSSKELKSCVRFRLSRGGVGLHGSAVMSRDGSGLLRG